MPMDYKLDRKVVLSEESEFKNLYKWSLQELDETGKKVGRDQIPWSWSVVFHGIEIKLQEAFKLETKDMWAILLKKEQEEDKKPKIEEREVIRIDLRPGYYGDEDAAIYSIFGTKRTINSFGLTIYKLDDGNTEERTYAWGCPSYTTEINFRDETTEDTLQFYLHAKAERFAKYVEMLRSHPVNLLTLRLEMVDGLYAEWSPESSTDRVKVLTADKEQPVIVPEGSSIVPSKLGEIGSFELSFTKRHSFDKPPLPPIDPADGELDKAIREADAMLSEKDDPLAYQKASLQVSLRIEKAIKYLTYAVGGVILVLIWALTK